MTGTLVIVFVLTMIIHTAETLSYSIRYAGVQVNKLAVALSLVGIVVLVSRTANLIQAPMTANFVDFAKVEPTFDLEKYLRISLFASSIGTLIAIALFPSFINFSVRIIARLEVAGSLPKLITSVTVEQLKNSKSYWKKPKVKLSQFRYLGVPKRLLLINIVVTAFYSVGVLASLYAAHLVPESATTASQASGLINGIATILLTIFIDPQLGLITDKALHDESQKRQLGKIYALLMTSRFLGTLLAQLFLIPSAHFIGWIVQTIF
ncbi:lipid II flippase Amj family protein [Paenibacillus sp. HWE-109]|uniref:lipid II flippase Amj family protein n=1 Tax=Paenibacillus sp. HWE-109 TaxID=1306526 RepID=UPI001EDEF877|nr:lipid II flippase Amj family protein [Paenibacillus sp. HWE-109]UKS29763.1 lipid II flippase Amj family protein [Paenibacillus sp. HWE-109]